eukprot:1158410-Pelagomonas_calceolata.AAC.8
MPGFRAGGALGEPGQPSVNFTGKKPNLGSHAPRMGLHQKALAEPLRASPPARLYEGAAQPS